MDNSNVPSALITTNQTVLCSSGMFNAPRLTPTGKISHAKTRVYTQRYRKEWEQMPDFKGWLTSVPFQDTRAFCTYCNKNLHAHRLSLLKHTCTMKHQRAALMHLNELNAKQATAVKIAEIEAGYEEDAGDVQQVHVVQRDNSDHEGEEDTEEYEYVVERLEMEDEELNISQNKREVDPDEAGSGGGHHHEDDEESPHCSTDEDDPLPMNKRIKHERDDDNCQDALAKAMAHVHGEYLDGTTDEQVNVELEMVVTSEDGVVQQAEHDTLDNVLVQHCAGQSHHNDNQQVKSRDGQAKFFTDGDSSEIGSESEISESGRVRENSDSYDNLSDKCSNIVGKCSFENAVPSSSGQRKTLKLPSGKTLTLRPGTQYLLSNVKGTNIPTIMMADRSKTVHQSAVSSISTGQTVSNGSQKLISYPAVPGASRLSSAHKAGNKTVAGGTKKPCISTHVMDTSKGLPVGGLQVSLYKLMDGRWTFLNESNTSPNGHCNDLVVNSKFNFTAGRYKMHFDVDKYFTLRRIETMYPFIEIVFDVKNPTGNYHIPVLLSPFGYTTYRGSDR